MQQNQIKFSYSFFVIVLFQIIYFILLSVIKLLHFDQMHGQDHSSVRSDPHDLDRRLADAANQILNGFQNSFTS